MIKYCEKSQLKSSIFIDVGLKHPEINKIKPKIIQI